jgi:predicted  nucleic acid-binding Zn-ribbon protein
MAMDVEAEIRDLKRRVSELEGSFGFLTEQVKGVHRDLLAFQGEMRAFQRETAERFGRVEAEVRQLREDMPGIVGDAMREVLREGRGS